MLRSDGRYQNTVGHSCNFFPSRASTFANRKASVVMETQSLSEFRALTMRESSTHLVLFVHSLDPVMGTVLRNLTPCLSHRNRLVVVAVDRIPELGVMYEITRPSLVKMNKGRIIRRFEKTSFGSEELCKFAQAQGSTQLRWPFVM